MVALAGGGASAVQARSDGAPIAVMTMGEFFANPQWPVAVKARFADLNRAGGIQDAAGTRHKVKVIVCDTEADPVQTQQCAQRAVDDRVVAVVGMSVLDSDAVWPLLEAAGIPVIGSRVNTDRDVSSPVAFPLGSGIVGTFSAMPQLLARQGAHKVAVVMSDFGAATSSALGLIESGLSRTSASAGPVVRVPLGVKSLAPYAAAATRDAVDGVIVFLERKEQAGLLRSLKVANFRGRIVTQASLSITGNPAIDDGTLGVGEFPPVNARGRGMNLFRSDMADAGISSSGLLGLDAGALNFWLAAWVFNASPKASPQSIPRRCSRRWATSANSTWGA